MYIWDARKSALRDLNEIFPNYLDLLLATFLTLHLHDGLPHSLSSALFQKPHTINRISICRTFNELGCEFLVEHKATKDVTLIYELRNSSFYF